MDRYSFFVREFLFTIILSFFSTLPIHLHLHLPLHQFLILISIFDPYLVDKIEKPILPVKPFSPRQLFTIGLIVIVGSRQLLTDHAVNASPFFSSESLKGLEKLRSPSLASSIPVSSKDETQFKLWVKYASAVYCNVESWKCGSACRGETANTTLLKSFEETVNKAYVALNDREKAIVVAFRGTANVEGFVRDTKFLFTDFPGVSGAKVHSGFLNTFVGTREKITNFIKETVPKYPGYKVVLTGHSLGGSMAVFQLLDLIGTPGLTPKNLFTYTYGEPRMGNDVFAKYVDKQGYKIFRIVNKNDIVPHVPPKEFQYFHHSPEIWVSPYVQ
ncbi:hypothetical protein G9A89_022342 [Geosiphon pyriformis]|nr:hypothetical protein G9A89_022342 [Geosiphon pyriformis]